MATITTRTAKGSQLTTVEMDANLTNLNADIATRATSNNAAFTGTATGITSTMVGLGNVDNTSDVNKPVSTATTNALALKLNNSIFAAAGLAEVGRYLDFHGTTSANDYDLRIDSGPTPASNGGANAVINCATLYVQGNLSAGNFTPFAVGTRMPFAQGSAPTGWTQDNGDGANNRMLRVVSGAGNGTGGTHSPILNNLVPSHTHTFNTGGESAAHTHYVNDPGHRHTWRRGTGGDGGDTGIGRNTAASFDSDTSFVGTGVYNSTQNANHFHSGGTDNGSSQTNWQPRYIDLIICSKN